VKSRRGALKEKPKKSKASSSKSLVAKKAPARKAKKRSAKATPKPAPSRGKRSAVQRGRPKKRSIPRPISSAPPTEPLPSPESVPLPTPSERLLATCAELPMERSLTDEEHEAMLKVSETAGRFIGAEGTPQQVISAIAAFVEEVRSEKREEPKSQDVRLGLGVLWGEQLRIQVGWRWVHLTYPDGFASYALVPDDRSFACFPLNRVPEALRPTGPNTSAHVFESIRENALPNRKPSAYLVIG
jgi:hypothetical protein